MSIVYADSSVLFAWFYVPDQFNAVVTAWLRDRGADFLSNEVLRLELRHNVRLVRDNPNGETAWQALQVAERSSARLRHDRIDLEKTFAQADALSRRLGQAHPCGAMDVFHVAAALVQEAPLFLTCDVMQADVARAAGLKVHDFSRGASRGSALALDAGVDPSVGSRGSGGHPGG